MPKVNTVTFREQWFTSVEVAIFLSLIFSYFCFLFPAFRPCQGRLTVIKPCVNTSQSQKWNNEPGFVKQPSSQEVHQYISKRFHVISPALFYVKQNTNSGIKTKGCRKAREICQESRNCMPRNRNHRIKESVLTIKIKLTNSKVGIHTCISCCSS